MANPVIVPCTAGQWTLVAENQTAGIIHILIDGAEYLQTYRDTGEEAPTMIEEGARFEGQLNISANAGIDVYVWCQTQNGKVRVDL